MCTSWLAMYEVLLVSASIMLSLICFMNDLKGKDGLNRNFIQRLFLFNSSGSISIGGNRLNRKTIVGSHFLRPPEYFQMRELVNCNQHASNIGILNVLKT